MAAKMTNKIANAIGETIRVNVEYSSIIKSRHEKIGYNFGIYGHNWDAYLIDGKVFIIGQRNLTGRPANNQREYAERWSSIERDYSLTWMEREEKLDALQAEFVAQA